MELIVALAIGVLAGSGVWLLLRPRTFQVVLGLALLSYAVNLFIFVTGRLTVGRPPIIRGLPVDPSLYADPVPQALVLTAIVISLATMGFLLALAYRLWQLSGTDDVPDDAEDARILDLALANETSSTYDPDVTPTTTADESARENTP